MKRQRNGKKILGFCVALLCAAVCAVTVSADAPRAEDYFTYVGLSARIADDYTGLRSTFALNTREVHALPGGERGIQYGIIMGKVREGMGEYSPLSEMTVALDETGKVVKNGIDPDAYGFKVVYDSKMSENQALNTPTVDYLVENAETGFAEIEYSLLFMDNATDQAALSNGYLLLSFQVFLIVDGNVSYLENSGTYVTSSGRTGVNPLSFYKQISKIFPEYKQNYRVQKVLYKLGLAHDPTVNADDTLRPMNYYYTDKAFIEYDAANIRKGAPTQAVSVIPAGAVAPEISPLLTVCASETGSYWEQSTVFANCYVLRANYSHTTEPMAATAPTVDTYGNIPCHICIHCRQAFLDEEGTRPVEYLYIPFGFDYADFYATDGTLVAEKFIYQIGVRLPFDPEKGFIGWMFEEDNMHIAHAVVR